MGTPRPNARLISSWAAFSSAVGQKLRPSAGGGGAEELLAPSPVRRCDFLEGFAGSGRRSL